LRQVSPTEVPPSGLAQRKRDLFFGELRFLHGKTTSLMGLVSSNLSTFGWLK
jgi:hypothetical protein